MRRLLKLSTVYPVMGAIKKKGRFSAMVAKERSTTEWVRWITYKGIAKSKTFEPNKDTVEANRKFRKTEFLSTKDLGATLCMIFCVFLHILFGINAMHLYQAEQKGF